MNLKLLEELADGIAADLVYPGLKHAAWEVGLTEDNIRFRLDAMGGRSYQNIQKLKKQLKEQK